MQLKGQAEQSSEGQPDRHLNGQPEQPRQHQQEAGSPIGLSLQHQQVAGMNGACMRGLLDANSEQPQTAVLTGLSCSLQPETGKASDGLVTLLLVFGVLPPPTCLRPLLIFGHVPMRLWLCVFHHALHTWCSTCDVRA